MQDVLSLPRRGGSFAVANSFTKAKVGLHLGKPEGHAEGSSASQ